MRGCHPEASVEPVRLDRLHQHQLRDFDQQNPHFLEATVQSGKGSQSEQCIVECRQSVRTVQQRRKQVFHRNANSNAQQNFQPNGFREAASPGAEGEGPSKAAGFIADLCQQQDAPEGHNGHGPHCAPYARHIEDWLETERGQGSLSATEEKTQDKGQARHYQYRFHKIQNINISWSEIAETFSIP